jgi:hypothetical protein
MMSDLEDVIDLAHVDRVTADQLYPFLAWALAVIPGAQRLLIDLAVPIPIASQNLVLGPFTRRRIREGLSDSPGDGAPPV